jgi:hypothetical protein
MSRVEVMPSRLARDGKCRLYVEDSNFNFTDVTQIVDFACAGCDWRSVHISIIVSSSDWIRGTAVLSKPCYVAIEFPGFSSLEGIDWNSIKPRNPIISEIPMIQSWKDALLWICAHELCHVRQFNSGSVSDVEAGELEAELAALEYLSKWQSHRSACTASP